MGVRRYQSFNIKPNTCQTLQCVLRWSESVSEHIAFLNTNNYKHDRYGNVEGVFAIGAANSFTGGAPDDFSELRRFADNINDWIFGFFSYELKNQLEKLNSKNPDGILMPVAHFFQPVIMIHMHDDSLEIGCLQGYGNMSDPRWVYSAITTHEAKHEMHPPLVKMKPRVSRKKYLDKIHAIKEHIQAGDIYEMNYCIEFFASETVIDPVDVYLSLNSVSPTPFSCFYKLDDKYLLCASPERFMKKQGQKIISQPIKGTLARGHNTEEDQARMHRLFNDPKERSENVMIVDLVRNDLARTAVKDSVRVEELFGIYPFRHVHQMISTVVSNLKPDLHFLDPIRCAFPMGSMTGAPKIRAMELIDQFEDTLRGLYSGAVGYIDPNKDFDFNVVIRSLLYNREKQYLSYMAGSAITAGSVPEKEYEECLLKAKAVLDATSELWASSDDNNQ